MRLPSLKWSAVLAVAIAPLSARSQQPVQQGAVDLASVIPSDPKVRTGVLPNGLTYYIRANAQPPKRAELRLAVNAGGIVEDDDQLGMAHLIEHMGFNGTTHFSHNALVDYLRTVGLRLGPDVNAGTGADETVYMLTIPTDTQKIVETGVTVLADWAHGQTLDSAEVANERGVVVEEWRIGQGANNRMMKQIRPIIYKDSRYATRDVIGTDKTIMSANVALLKRFYNDWYRPDLEAVIVVGDVDPAAIEAQIKRDFGTTPKPTNARPRIAYDIPDNVEPLIGIATDKEAQQTQIQLGFKLPHKETKTVADYRANLSASLVSAMLSARLQEIMRQPDAPFAFAFAGKGGFTRNKDIFSLGAIAKDGGGERALEALLTEARRASQFGFLQSELDRAKQSTLRNYEQQYINRDKTASNLLVNRYVNTFLMHTPAPGIEYEYPVVQQLLPTITLAEVNQLTGQWMTERNRIAEVFAPDKPGTPVPTEADVRAAFTKVASAPIVAYTENVSADPLVARMPARGRVMESSTDAAAGVTKWLLSNGAHVIIKPTDFRADQILFGAYAPGGTSLVSDADFPSARFAANVVFLGGVGTFSANDLTKKLAAKVANVSPFISEDFQGLNGSGSPKDLETLLQLAYLRFTAPRMDSSAFLAFKNQQRSVMANQGTSPESNFSDTLTATMSQHHPRAKVVTAQTWDEIQLDKAFAVYRDRFSNAGEFTFVFVGAVDTAALKPLAEQYLASLPSTGRTEAWKDVGIRPPTGVVEKPVRKGSEPKSLTYMMFTGQAPYTDQNSFDVRALSLTVEARLIDILREQMSGTYSPGISGNLQKVPYGHYTMQIFFSSSPDNADKLTRTALGIIDSIQTRGPTPAEVEKVREQLVRGHESEMKQNLYWINSLMTRGENGDDLGSALSSFDAMVKGLSAAEIQAAAKQFLNTKNYVHVVLLPESGPVRP